jgi:hypothetical protein
MKEWRDHAWCAMHRSGGNVLSNVSLGPDTRSVSQRSRAEIEQSSDEFSHQHGLNEWLGGGFDGAHPAIVAPSANYLHLERCRMR